MKFDKNILLVIFLIFLELINKSINAYDTDTDMHHIRHVRSHPKVHNNYPPPPIQYVKPHKKHKGRRSS